MADLGRKLSKAFSKLLIKRPNRVQNQQDGLSDIEHPNTTEAGDSCLLNMPDDCIVHFMSMLPSTKDLICLRLTCRRLYDLSRVHAAWTHRLDALSDTLSLPPFPPSAYHHPAPSLERLATARSRFRLALSSPTHKPHSCEAYVDDSHAYIGGPPDHQRRCELHTLPGERVRTAVFVAPGWLLTGSAIIKHQGAQQDPNLTRVGIVKLWRTGLEKVAEPLRVSTAKYVIEGFGAEEFRIEKTEEESHIFNVLVASSKRNRCIILRMTLPLDENDTPTLTLVDKLRVPMKIKDIHFHGDLVAFLNANGSVALWNWSQSTWQLIQPKDRDDTQRGYLKSQGRVVIHPPFLFVVSGFQHRLFLYRIPSTLAAIKPNLPIPRLSVSSVNFKLPKQCAGDMQIVPLSGPDEGAADGQGWAVQVDMFYPSAGRAVRYAVRCLRKEESAEDQAKVKDKEEKEKNGSVGKSGTMRGFKMAMLETQYGMNGLVGVPGSLGFLSPQETDLMIEKLRAIKVLPRPSLADDELASMLLCSTGLANQQELYRMLGEVRTMHSRPRRRIALDPVLGRVCVVEDDVLHLIDFV